MRYESHTVPVVHPVQLPDKPAPRKTRKHFASFRTVPNGDYPARERVQSALNEATRGFLAPSVSQEAIKVSHRYFSTLARTGKATIWSHFGLCVRVCAHTHTHTIGALGTAHRHAHAGKYQDTLSLLGGEGRGRGDGVVVPPNGAQRS